MTTFTTSDSIFDPIKLAEGVSPTALQNFVNALNEDPYANAQVSAMINRGTAVFEVVPHQTLVEHGAAALYDSGRTSDFVDRGGKFAVRLDQDWFVNRTTTVDGHTVVTQVAAWATSVGASSRIGLTIHEVQHNASQSWYDEAYRLRDTSPAAYRPELTGAERAAASVELIMRAEVAGWYADLQTLRSLRDSGQMTPTEYHMRTQENTVYANLMDAELSGKAMGNSGAALANYVAEHAQGSLPSNYVANYTSAMTPPSVSQAAVRSVLGYALNDPAQMTSFEEQTGPEGSYTAMATYSNGERISTTYDGYEGVYSQIKEIRQADGSYRTARTQVIESYNTDGSPGDQIIRSHDSAGRLAHVIEIDGARDNTDYNTRTTTWDAQERKDWFDVLRDDGNRDWTDYDQTSTQPWTRVESRFDAQGREDYATVSMDDGSRTVHDYDQTNARGDRTWQTHVDAQGRTDWTNVIQDDGNVDFTDYDQTNVRADSIFQNRTDAWGRQDWVNIFQDDGSRDWTDYDQAGSQGWSAVASHFDARGREDFANVYLDDGSRDQHDYDQDGSQGWHAVVSHFDAWGREAHASMYRDDGSRDWLDYDENGSQGWNRVESHFDALGREAHASMFLDDGSRDWYDYDQDGSQGWGALVSHFDASGREAHANLYMDDGSRNWYDYDQDGSQAWSRVQSRFDAWGREDEATMLLDDGRRKRYDYDQDNTQYWSRVEQDFDVFGRETIANVYQDDGGRTQIDYTVQAGYRVVSRFNAQGYKILEETSAWLPGGPLPAPLAPAVGPVPMSPFYVPPNAAPLNPFVPSPFAPFYFQEPPVPAPAPEWDLEVDVRIPEPEPYI